MSVQKTHHLKVLALSIAICVPSEVMAEVLTCIKKYELYAQAQTTWQHESAKAAINLLPEHADRINLYRDTQLTAIKRRTLAVSIALEHFPKEISTWGSLNQWLDLTPDLAAKMVKISPDFKELSTKYDALLSQPTKEGGEAFQQIFRKTVLADTQFIQLMSDFDITSREINSTPCEQ